MVASAKGAAAAADEISRRLGAYDDTLTPEPMVVSLVTVALYGQQGSMLFEDGIPNEASRSNLENALPFVDVALSDIDRQLHAAGLGPCGG